MARRPGQAMQVDTFTTTLCPGGRAVKHLTAVDRRPRWGSAMAAANATGAMKKSPHDRAGSDLHRNLDGRDQEGG